MTINHKGKRIDYLIVAVLIAAFLIILEFIYPFYFFQNDNIDSYICGYKYAYEAILHGKIALYNFHQLLGTPFFAQGQSGSVYLPALISVLFSYIFCGNAVMTTEISVFLHLMLAGVGMYRLCEKMSLGRIASYVAALSWALNSFTIYESRVWLIVAIASAWLPMMVSCSINLLEKADLKTYILAAFPRLALFYGGHPQFWAYAVIFEFVFFFLLCILNLRKNKREFFVTLMRYVNSYVLTLFGVLPLLLPMWRVMSSSSERSSSLSLEVFLDHKYDIRSFLVGVLIPFTQIDGYEAKNTFEEIAINASHYGYVLFFATIFGTLMIVKSLRSGAKAKISSFYPAAAIAMLFGILWQSSETVNRLFYYVPLLNRFRWPYKLNLEVMFFAVILGALSLQELLKDMSPKKSKTVNPVLVAAVLINFGLLYMVAPFKYHGLRVEGDLNERCEYYDLLTDSRYATIGFPQWIFNDDLSQEANHANELNYNFATYYGFENFSGYNVLSPQDVFETNGEYEYIPLTGSICNPTEAFIGHLRDLGVKTYVVSKYACFGQSVEASFTKEFGGDDMFRFLEDQGMTLVSDHEFFRVYSDPQALYPIYTLNGEGTAVPIEYSNEINSLSIKTPEDFAGGTLYVGYRFDDRLSGKLDGSSIVIDKNDELDTMLIDVPAGAHTIDIAYKDNMLTLGLILWLSGTGVFSLLVIIKQKHMIGGK